MAATFIFRLCCSRVSDKKVAPSSYIGGLVPALNDLPTAMTGGSFPTPSAKGVLLTCRSRTHRERLADPQAWSLRAVPGFLEPHPRPPMNDPIRVLEAQTK